MASTSLEDRAWFRFRHALHEQDAVVKQGAADGFKHGCQSGITVAQERIGGVLRHWAKLVLHLEQSLCDAGDGFR